MRDGWRRSAVWPGARTSSWSPRFPSASTTSASGSKPGTSRARPSASWSWRRERRPLTSACRLPRRPRWMPSATSGWAASAACWRGRSRRRPATRPASPSWATCSGTVRGDGGPQREPDRRRPAGRGALRGAQAGPDHLRTGEHRAVTRGGHRMTAISMGKLASLMRLADAAGRFKMLAIDQRDSLRKALGKATGREAEQVTYNDMAATKTLITEVLSPYSTATLVDPVYGLPRAVKVIPGDVGVLAATEETGYERAGPGGKERKSGLIDGWSVAKAKRAGANAVKLLIYYNPEASSEVCAHQQQLVRRVGEDCVREDIPFLLELVTYPIAEPSADTPEFARRRPQHTIETTREFSKDEYRVDILKL